MKIEIRLEPAGYCTRRHCLFCGETDNKESVIAAVYEDGEFTGYVVCPDYPTRAGCVSAPATVLAERLLARAAAARAEADALEATAANLPTIPTMAALQAATAEWEVAAYGTPVPVLSADVDSDGLVF